VTWVGSAAAMCAVFGTGLNRRCLGNNFDQRLRMTHTSFVVTADNRFILAVGFWDKSFRVFGTDLGNRLRLIRAEMCVLFQKKCCLPLRTHFQNVNVNVCV